MRRVVCIIFEKVIWLDVEWIVVLHSIIEYCTVPALALGASGRVVDFCGRCSD